MKYLLTIIVFLITVTSQAQWISFGTSLSTPSNLANANYSLSFGNETTTLGDYSTSMGRRTIASDFGSLVIGQFNSSGSSVTNSANEFSTANTAFVIGNGLGTDANASDAFSILFDGTTIIAGSVTATSFVGDGSGLTGITGTEGKSAYEIAVDNGFTGTITEWLLSLNGTNGTNGIDGVDGEQGPTGADGEDGTDGIDGVDGEDGGDDQQLENFNLDNNSILHLSIQNGNDVNVNLSPLLEHLEGLFLSLQIQNIAQQYQIDQLQIQIEDLTDRIKIREDCACDPTLGNEDNTLQPNKAYLLQNIPNPFENTTSIGYFVPYTNAKAHIVISTMAGQIVHNMELLNLGVGAVSIDNSRMASAIYLYTLYVDGKRIDSKRMIVE
tara:strand:- start:114 stop:1262 length:1149 start_codon:yes stop_codon:yes gene_type:complete